nr:phragmoplast-associated kinesin-related protein [Tanacetum cinerariifolium]
MEASSKDRPPMLAPSNYVQWKSRIKRYIDTKPNHELIHYCLKNPPYKYTWADKVVPVSEGSPETTTKRYMENYKNVSQYIRDQLNAKAEAVQIILTRIDNDIYSTVDACPNACEMWKAIERLKPGESINVQDLETNLYWEFGKFTSRDGESLESYYSRFYHMMNELVRNQCDVTNHQVNVQGKAIVNSSPPIYDQEPSMVAEDNEMSKDKEIDKLMALISLSFKKIYKPTNNNLRTSSNTSRANQDNFPRINRGTGHVARECQKPKRVKDAAYHKEKMLLCKQEEAGIQLNAEQADWRDDTDDESEDQELEAHYMYMAQIQEVTPDAADDSGPIFDTEPLQKVSNNDHYNMFAIESEHPEEHIDHDDDDDDNDLANERELLASLIEKLKCEIDDSKNRTKFLEISNKVSLGFNGLIITLRGKQQSKTSEKVVKKDWSSYQDNHLSILAKTLSPNCLITHSTSGKTYTIWGPTNALLEDKSSSNVKDLTPQDLERELEGSRLLVDKQKNELDTERKSSKELKDAMEMAMEGHDECWNTGELLVRLKEAEEAVAVAEYL